MNEEKRNGTWGGISEIKGGGYKGSRNFDEGKIHWGKRQKGAKTDVEGGGGSLSRLPSPVHYCEKGRNKWVQ